MKILSVVMPVYNGAGFVDEAIKSVLAQDADFELIVVDDGSTDGTCDIVNKYAAHDERVRLISGKRAGVTSARLLGADLARGEFLWFMDADDTLPPGILGRVQECINSEPKGDLFVTDIIHISASGEKAEQPYGRNANTGAELFDDIINQRTGFLWSKGIRRALFQNLPYVPYGLKFCEDYVQMLQLAAKAGVVVHVGEAGYEYRQQPESACNRKKTVDEYASQFYNLGEALRALTRLTDVFNPGQRRRLKVMFLYYMRLYLAVAGSWRSDKENLRREFKDFLHDRALRSDSLFDTRRRWQCRLISASSRLVAPLYRRQLRRQGRIF